MAQESINKIMISPSILAADFGHLADEAKRVADAGADSLHIDVMDGHFVPNLTIGHQVVAAIRRATNLFLDVHIMVYQPFDYIEKMVESGANRITFHFEATEDVADVLSYIRRCNVEAGLAFCPETSETMILKYLNQIDLLLLMTVHPGYGGQKFMDEVLSKIRFARETVNRLGIRKGGVVMEEGAAPLPPLTIQVDGGINNETAKLCAEAGANNFVAGTHLFQSEDLQQAISQMRSSAEDGWPE